MTTPQDINEARAELQELRRQVRAGGKVFYIVIPGLIGVVLIGGYVSNGARNQGILGLALLLFGWVVLTLCGIHPDAPPKYNRQLYERISYLEGFIAAQEIAAAMPGRGPEQPGSPRAPG